MKSINFLNGKTVKHLPYRKEEDAFKLCADIIEKNYTEYVAATADPVPHCAYFPDLTHNGTDPLPIVLCGYNTSVDMLISSCKAVCITQGVSRVVLAFETYYIDLNHSLPNIRPSENPFRIEGFSICLLTPITSICRSYKVVRNKHRELQFLGETQGIYTRFQKIFEYPDKGVLNG